MPTFDGETLIMTLDAPTDGALIQDVEIDWYVAWKDWILADTSRLKYPPVFFESFGGNELTPSIDAGAYFVFQNQRGWRIRAFEANATIYVAGNVAPKDSALPITIPTIGAYTVFFDGLQPITQNIDSIQESLSVSTYTRDLGITIDPDNGVDFNSGIEGNSKNPIKTEERLHSLMTDLGMRRAYVKNSLNIYKDHSRGHSFYGDEAQSVIITLGDVATYPLKDVSNCKFQDCTITGEFDTINQVRDCIVGSVTNANGFIYNSTIIGPIVVSSPLSIEESWTATIGADNVIDFNGIANPVAITDWSGGTILVKNMVAGCLIGIGGTAGSIKFDSSCTGGSINYGGAIRIKEDLSTGTTINDATTASQVWTHPTGVDVSTKISIQNKILRNETETNPVTGIMTVYDDDGVTVLFTANIWENIAKTTPYGGNAVNRRARLV